MNIPGFLKTIEGLSANTLRAYRTTLLIIQDKIAGAEPTDGEIEAFLKGYAPASLHRHRAALKAYLEYRGRQWPFNPRTFRKPKSVPVRWLEVKVVEKMASAAATDDERMLVDTLFTLGCRISELMGIEDKHISQAGVAVVAKGGNTVLKEITPKFYERLKRYTRGKRGKIFPETYNFYYALIRQLGARAGHPEASPHMLRHARAVDLLDKGLPLSYVQQFLDHSNINTTARYLKVTGSHLGKKLEEVDS